MVGGLCDYSVSSLALAESFTILNCLTIFNFRCTKMQTWDASQYQECFIKMSLWKRAKMLDVQAKHKRFLTTSFQMTLKWKFYNSFDTNLTNVSFSCSHNFQVLTHFIDILIFNIIPGFVKGEQFCFRYCDFHL